MDWILIVPMAAFALLTLAGWLVAWKTHHEVEMAYTRSYISQEERMSLYAEIADLRKNAEKDAELYRQLHDGNTHLLAQNADLREGWQECIAERDSLKLQLSSVHATKPVQPSVQVKRMSRKKDEVVE